MERTLDAALKDVENLCQGGITRWAKVVMGKAKDKVPLDTHNLQKSGFIVSRGTRQVAKPNFVPYPGHPNKLVKAELYWSSVVGQAIAEVSAIKGRNSVVAIFGFPLDYAFAVHEDMGFRVGPGRKQPGDKGYRFNISVVDATRDDGRGPKYLEDAVIEELDTLPRLCAKAVKDGMARRGGTRLPRAVPVDIAAVESQLEELGRIQ